jgi:hypothetical protein
MRRFALVLMLSIASAAFAQSDTDILSKDDAAQVFAMTRQQWRDNLNAIVRAGLGTGTGDALTLKTPEGSVTTLPLYSQNDPRPSRLEVTVHMDAPHSARFTDALVADMTKAVRQQMSPEYMVDVRTERGPRGAMRFLFAVSKARR